VKTFVLDIRTATPHFPGIGRYVAGLAPALAAQLTDGERLVLLCNDVKQKASFRQVLNSNAAVSTCRIKATPFSLSQQWQISRRLRQLSKNPGALVYHSPYYLMPYWLGIPTVLTVHDLIPILLPETVSSRARVFFRFTHRLALHSANRIIAVSDATASDLARLFSIGETQVAVVHHGVESRFCPQAQAELDRLRRAYDLPTRIVLYLGINKPHKNLVRLMQAYALLDADAPTLVIAGSWDRRYLEAKEAVAKYGLNDRVRFLGPVNDSDLPGLYAAATVFVFPSFYEGFGFPVLEAMACGTPVACSNVSSLPEITGSSALLFDPFDTSSMAKAMDRLLNDSALRSTLRYKALERATQLTWNSTARQTLDIYRSLC